jgi:hypothetical protein
MVMHTHPFYAPHICPKYGLVSVAAVLALLLIPLGLVRALPAPGSNTQPLAFGPDQVIIVEYPRIMSTDWDV